MDITPAVSESPAATTATVASSTTAAPPSDHYTSPDYWLGARYRFAARCPHSGTSASLLH